MTFTQVLNKVMEDKRIKLPYIAETSGVNYRQLLRYYNGENKPSFDKAMEILGSLGYELDVKYKLEW